MATHHLRSRIAIAVLFWVSLTQSFGQAGQNAVMNGNNKQNSAAFVDASNYQGTQQNICTTISKILSDYATGSTTANGIVIDARGKWTSANLICGTTNPWPGDTLASVVLLPAATLSISSTWTIPQNTRLVGQGPGATVIQASSGVSGDMIDMGGPNYCAAVQMGAVYDCQDVVIEHLRLDGGGFANVNGIVNTFSEELSSVDDVSLTNISGTGLILGVYNQGGKKASAVNSGPYTRIYFAGNGTCAQIVGQIVPGNSANTLGVSTRGIHGLTCVTAKPSGAAVYLDGSNNSLEDISITNSQTQQQQGSLEGILIGSQSSAENNVLANISGVGLANVIHISNNNGKALDNCPRNACHITVLGVSSTSSTAAIQDDLTSTTITDSTVGLYVVGEQVFDGSNNPIGYSRFSTSPSFASWLVGENAPTSSCATGTLYSCTGSTSQCTANGKHATIWGCASGAWGTIQ